jgi:hypothetical protein
MNAIEKKLRKEDNEPHSTSLWQYAISLPNQAYGVLDPAFSEPIPWTWNTRAGPLHAKT